MFENIQLKHFVIFYVCKKRNLLTTKRQEITI